MHTLIKDAIQAIEDLSAREQKYCMDLIGRLKRLGLHEHASNAICALGEAPAMPLKR